MEVCSNCPMESTDIIASWYNKNFGLICLVAIWWDLKVCNLIIQVASLFGLVIFIPAYPFAVIERLNGVLQGYVYHVNHI